MMKIGLALPHIGEQATAENVREFALYAERNGWDSLWTGERLLHPINPKTPYPGKPDGKLRPATLRVLEHLSVLTYVSAITDTVRLGISVLILPYHNPALLGKRLASVDQLSHGRLTVGVGVGWAEDEFDAAGGPFRDRGAAFEEGVQALRAMWGPDPVKFSGKHYTIPESIIQPKPVQHPLPLLMGGFAGPKAMDRAGRLADGFTIAAVPVDTAIDTMGRARQAAEKHGRDPENFPINVRTNVILTPDDSDLPEDGRLVTNGSWEQVTMDIHKMAAAGIDEVFFDINHLPGANDLQVQFDIARRLHEICQTAISASR